MISTRTIITLAAASVFAAGCSSTTSSPTTQELPAASPSSASEDCADFDNAFDRTVTQFAYLKLAVRSDLDETERLATLTDYTSTLAADAATCAPEAAASLTALRDQTAALTDAYVPSADEATATELFSLLVEIRATGEQAWAERGRPAGGWKELPLHSDGSTS